MIQSDEPTSARESAALARQRDRDLFAKELDFAQWIADAAQISYCGVFAGCSGDRALRRARCRELIAGHNLADRRIADVRGETFAQRFERLYGEPLMRNAPPDSPLPTQLEVTLCDATETRQRELHAQEAQHQRAREGR
jgi:hypothetical protein